MKKRIFAILISLFVFGLSNLALAHPLEGLDLPSLENGEMPTQNEIIDALYRAGRLPENFYDKMPESALTSREPARRSWDAEPPSPEAMREEMERRDAEYRRIVTDLHARSERELQERIASMEESLAELEGTGETVGLRTACTCSADAAYINGNVTCSGTGTYSWVTPSSTITGSITVTGGCILEFDDCDVAVGVDIYVNTNNNELKVTGSSSSLTVGGSIFVYGNSKATFEDASYSEIENSIVAYSNTLITVQDEAIINFMNTAYPYARFDLDSDADIFVVYDAGIGCGVDSTSDGIGDEFCNSELILHVDGGTTALYTSTFKGFSEHLRRNGDGDVVVYHSIFRNVTDQVLRIQGNDSYTTFYIVGNWILNDQNQGPNALQAIDIYNCNSSGVMNVTDNLLLDVGAYPYSAGIRYVNSLSENLNIEDNFIYATEVFGILVYNTSVDPDYGVVSMQNNFVSDAVNGIHVEHKSNVTLEENFVWESSSAGIYISDSEDVEISGIRNDYLELWESIGGIVIEDSSDIAITDIELGRSSAHVNDPLSGGIAVKDSEDVSIEGFIADLGQFGRKGVYVENSSDTEIKYSRIEGFTDVGIELLSTDPTHPTEDFNIYGNELISRNAKGTIVSDSIGILVGQVKSGNDLSFSSQINCNDIQTGTGIRNESEYIDDDNPMRFITGWRFLFGGVLSRYPNRIWVPSTGGKHYDLPEPDSGNCENYDSAWSITSNCATITGTNCLIRDDTVFGECDNETEVAVTYPITGNWPGFLNCTFPEWW